MSAPHPPKKPYDSTLARMAGNIAGSLVHLKEFNPQNDMRLDLIADVSVEIAQKIIERLSSAEPPKEPR